ncbi:ABC transporter permease [Botrimarina mediterranea]|uniref:Oligopeptide transport system permease protein OppC n=1 Tax=Botrimarina mediterranea TaxID=2528022 RepID=A0A518K5G2_9BACT|nr:ABC transporter permease [Botrimarina mediterranea]QDV73015.1 Oligopeptide transport system permease protein OppC [Botrimarina mediterranea]
MTPTPTQPTETGVSLTQDAWRRLKKSWAAMASLGTLVAVVLLAFFTPLLPLAPPDRDETPLMLTGPVVWPPLVEAFKFDAAQIETLAEPIAEAKSKLREALGEYSATRRSTDATDDEVEEKARQVLLARAAVDSQVQRPYASAGFPKLGPLARLMVCARYAIFGEWELNSVCGRDKLGRDLLSRIFWGARVSLIVGFVATLVSLVIGVTYGAVSGYAGGWVDDLMMRIVDVLYSIPFVFLVIFIISILSEESVKERLAGYGIDRITIFYFVVGAIYWLTMARVVRGQVVSLRNEQYVEAARSLGVSQTAIVFRHLVPNLLSIVLVYLTLTIPRVILFEAFLSFLGLGVEPPDVSWGLLANEGIQVITPVKIYWWLIVFPSVAIGATLFALNFLGDGLRDAFDPRMKGR